MKIPAFLLLLLIALISVFPTTAQDACALPPRLSADMWGRVLSGEPNNLRETPTRSAALIGQIPAGDIFRVIDGPTCVEGYNWWQVNYAGTLAWTAEGRDDYWLESIGEIPLPNPDDPEGCQLPPASYEQLVVGYGILNLRTLAMLDHAQELYGGVLNFRQNVMQGGYNPGGVAASFGTHDGGGAIDLAVRDPITRNVLADEIAPMLLALRTAGFAAWLRDTDELYPGSPIHIHAIAVGDAELSEAARGQIDGDFGYLRGFNGLPQDSGIPLPDTSGEMVICSWMVNLGFDDLRPAEAGL
ncbi:MAG: SH3 domain-containing protein [Anaerolineae bacterium]|nr:SH3 domain-containing protein [Anaerolineae bacterium]